MLETVECELIKLGLEGKERETRIFPRTTAAMPTRSQVGSRSALLSALRNTHTGTGQVRDGIFKSEQSREREDSAVRA